MCSNPNKFQHIVVSGSPFTRGKSHGIQAKEKILTGLEHYKKSKKMPPWEDCIAFVESNYVPALEKFYPRGLEEMKGIAEGANVTLADILIINARYDLSRWSRWRYINSKSKKTTEQVDEIVEDVAECSGAVALKSATRNNHVLIGQNWDINEFILNEDTSTAILLEVHPDSGENIKPFVMFGEAGQLGRTGMNAEGLGVVGMGLWSSDEVFEVDPRKPNNGWIPVTILRRMFIESPTFSKGLHTILSVPRHVSLDIIVATGEDEALNIELSANEYFITQIPLDKEIMSHSNHFKSEGFLACSSVREGSRLSSSLFRDRRILKHLSLSWPNISEETFQEAFKDHVGYPNSVCAHSVPPELSWTSTNPNDTTVCSIIYNLSERTLQLCKGPPCKGTFEKYGFIFSK